MKSPESLASRAIEMDNPVRRGDDDQLQSANSAATGAGVDDQNDSETSPLLREFSPAQVEALRGEFGPSTSVATITDDGRVVASVKGVVAQLTECPMNWQYVGKSVKVLRLYKLS